MYVSAKFCCQQNSAAAILKYSVVIALRTEQDRMEQRGMEDLQISRLMDVCCEVHSEVYLY